MAVLDSKPEEYFDLSLICEFSGATSDACRSQALEAGLISLAGSAGALVLSFLFLSRTRPLRGVRELRPSSPVVVLFWLALLLGWSFISGVSRIPDLSRIQSITNDRAFISLGNLLWPLVAQLIYFAKTWTQRGIFLFVLLVLANVSPFRGVVMVIGVFGFFIPIAGILRKQFNQVGVYRRSMLIVACAVVIGSLFGGWIYSDTVERTSSSIPNAVPNAESQYKKLVQRLAYPLYQAIAIGKISDRPDLPGFFEDVYRKFGLTTKVNANGYLYRQLYGGDTSGQTTALYFGEAAAFGRVSPFVWTLIAPISLFIPWILVRRFGVESGAIIGIAVWRGSLSGVVAVLPALLVQLAVLMMLTRRVIDEPQDTR